MLQPSDVIRQGSASSRSKAAVRLSIEWIWRYSVQAGFFPLTQACGSSRISGKVASARAVIASKVVDDGEIEAEIDDGVRVRIVRGMIQDVRSKTEPVKN